MLIRSLILAAALAAPTLASAQGVLTGSATVIDGDTVVVNDTHIRLHGIDAPEADQTCSVGVQTYACGTAATEALRDLLRGQTLSCLGMGLDPYGRTLAACYYAGVQTTTSLLTTGRPPRRTRARIAPIARPIH
jgi:endonuclease YncB( thermonuclease family)